MTFKRTIPGLAALALFLGVANAYAGIVIDPASKPGAIVNFNGFEGAIPFSGAYFDGSSAYSEDGISVQQIASDDKLIWLGFFSTQGGSQGWYPDAGDTGYTRITRDGGGDFSDLYMDVSTGQPLNPQIPVSVTLLYELYKDDLLVLAGIGPSLTQGITTVIGFLGGGFDEVRIRDTTSDVTSVDNVHDLFGDHTENTLAVDSIENRGAANVVPEPASLTLWGIGAIGLVGCFRRWRRKSPELVA